MGRPISLWLDTAGGARLWGICRMPHTSREMRLQARYGLDRQRGHGEMHGRVDRKKSEKKDTREDRQEAAHVPVIDPSGTDSHHASREHGARDAQA